MANLQILQKDPKSPLYSVKSFEALNLKKELLYGIYNMGYYAPSKIQETALPVLLADPPVNMIAQSQNGTGKTAAFVLTMLSRVNTNLHYPQCLCIAPTYELVLQIGKHVEEMGKFMTDLKIEYAIRGEKLSKGTKLDGHMIIGTPGTVCDWALKFCFFDLKKIQVFVLDEADVLIATQGHQNQSIRIQRGLVKDCQMLSFSATYEDDVMRFAQAVIPNKPIIIQREEQSFDSIKQYYIECSDQEGKFQTLSNKQNKQNTSSSHWRTKGNGIYVTASDNLCPSIRKERLRQAANCYYKAYNFSTNEDEKVSAAKNLAMVSWKMARVDEQCLERFSLIILQYKESFKYFSFGFHHSVGLKPDTWRDGLLASAKSCWEELRSGRFSELTTDNRAHTYHDLIQYMQMPEIQTECYIELANCHFHCGITAIQNKDFKRGLYEMRDCYMPINEAKRLQGDKANLKAEVRILEEDVFMHQCMAESLQAISVGDQLYKKLLLDEEILNMDMVYEVIDWYKQAVLCTREVTEVEIEAVALSRLGRVYDKVLKIKYKAKEYLMRSMQLAHSMHPRTFNSEDWFKDCAGILERYQKETVSAEQEKWNKEREEIIKGIEKEMKDIDKSDKDDSREFLRYVYRVFPPKNKEHKLEENVKEKGSNVDHSTLKKTLQKAIIHYHPDKVDVEEHGKVWKVLSEEITKRLTRRYESMK